MHDVSPSFPVLDALKLFLEAGGCDVNVVNNRGDTPLHLAVTLKPRHERVHIFTNKLKLRFCSMEVLIMILSTMMVKHPWPSLKLMKLA